MASFTTNDKQASSKATDGSGRASDRSSGGAVAGRRVCTFEEEGARYAIDVTLVGEVLVVERVVGVALAPTAVLGVFNCRGTPIPLIDLGVTLGLRPVAPALEEGATATALMVHRGALQVGIRVQRVEAVVDAEQLLPGDERVDRHIEGLLESEDASVPPVQVLSTKFLLHRLRALRMRAQ